MISVTFLRLYLNPVVYKLFLYHIEVKVMNNLSTDSYIVRQQFLVWNHYNDVLLKGILL